ncbi:MAG TPA: DUF1579 family protein [Candidatus Angelobacter sp.]|nr:DUF1579 family protein [Candidatus Angelobacter sp.]
MKGKTAVLMISACLIVALLAIGVGKAEDDPVQKLGAFLGKWQTDGTFANGSKVHSELECRWSPQRRYLICEQQVSMGNNVTDQLTVYGYDAKSGKYSYSSFQGNSAAPSTGALEIKGNVWIYNSSFESKGKRTDILTTNEFTDAKTEQFKVATSDDGGVTWNTGLQGSAHKVAN